jgi:uncharacterized protein
MEQSTFISPISPSGRILSIDLLRGFAVLGILIMNIQTFAMIHAAYMNPDAWGDLTGINKWAWIISHVVASEKFMTLFSILFGAGVLLFSTRATAKGRRSGPLHYRRMFWLLIFGMLHAYLIWYGDILVAYSLCGMLVFLFRKMKPKKLIVWAGVFFIVPVLLSLFSGATMGFWPQESIDAGMESWKPSAEKIAEEIAAMQGGWLEQMEIRVPTALFMQTFVFFWFVIWRCMAMMLLGMALFKTGVLLAEKSGAFYLRMAIVGIVVGFALSGWGVYANFEAGWSMAYSQFFGSQFNYFGSVFTAFGYMGIVMLLAKSVKCGGIKRVLSAVGKMAFTNYILMSLMGMFIFYGNGLGLFSQVERAPQLLYVVAIWIVLLILSPIWLKYFRFGPLEWFWRVLTYWKYKPSA